MPQLAKLAQSATLCCGVTLAALVTVPEVRARPACLDLRGSEILPPALAGRLGAEWTGVAGYAAAQFDISDESVAQRLRNQTDLPVTVLSRLAGVSRQTYHSWLVGESISADNLARLEQLLVALREISSYQDVRRFLKRPVYGTTPQVLLEAGKFELAAQIARGAVLSPSVEPDLVTAIPWDDPSSDLMVSYLYHIDPAAARPERVQASEFYHDEVIGLGSVVITG